MRPYVFNSPEYLELEADRLGGTPIRLACGDGPVIGLIMRQIPGSTLRDGVSVYGYPDLDQREPVPRSVEADRILEALRSEGAVDGLVSVFFRLGLDQDVQGPHDPSLARKVRLSDVVFVDLQRDWSRIFSGFRPRLRTALRNAFKGIDVEPSDDVLAFYSIYTENMIRVGAREDYHFNLNYMQRLFRIPGVELFLAMDNAGPLAGALVVSHGDLLFYHLGATADRGLAGSALKFVLSEVMRHYADGPFRSLVLGGGLRGESDLLLRFKRGYSHEIRSAHALKAILNSQSYAALLGLGREQDPFAGFFPAYRDPARIERIAQCPLSDFQPGPRVNRRRKSAPD